MFKTKNLNQLYKWSYFYDETIKQKTSEGTTFPEFLSNNEKIPGIKVDKGVIAFPQVLMKR